MEKTCPICGKPSIDETICEECQRIRGDEQMERVEAELDRRYPNRI